MDPKTAIIVKTELALHGWSQAKLCKALGISEAMFSYIINGKQPASRELIGRIFYEIHRPDYEAAGLLPTAAGNAPELLATAVAA